MHLVFSAGQLSGLPAPTAEEDVITFASLLCSGQFTWQAIVRIHPTPVKILSLPQCYHLFPVVMVWSSPLGHYPRHHMQITRVEAVLLPRHTRHAVTTPWILAAHTPKQPFHFSFSPVC